MNLKKLKEPFPAKDIEWRVSRAGEKGNKIWALVLAYVTNRAIMERLDDVVGPEKWQNEFAAGPNGGMMCAIKIKVGDEWITKWDGADNTNIEAVKGGFSDSMKRAGYQWGIGRYLYNLTETFAKINPNGKHSGKLKDNKWFKWDSPDLPAWALPHGTPPKKSSTKKEKPNPKKQSQKKSSGDDYPKSTPLQRRNGIYKHIGVLKIKPEDFMPWASTYYGYPKDHIKLFQALVVKAERDKAIKEYISEKSETKMETEGNPESDIPTPESGTDTGSDRQQTEVEFPG